MVGLTGIINNMKKIFVLLLIFFLVVLFLIIFFSKNTSKHNLTDIKGIKIAEQNIEINLALIPAEQAQGLSGRSELKENEGMLFIFPEPGQYNFWMKDMNFPIDIIWLDEDLKIVYIKKDARPESYPETYGPASPSQGGPDVSLMNVKYVLEVVSGFSDKNNLKVGDRVIFLY